MKLKVITIKKSEQQKKNKNILDAPPTYVTKNRRW